MGKTKAAALGHQSVVANPSRPRSLRTYLHKHLGAAQLLSVAANSGWLMADKLVRAVVGLLVATWVARYLGPQQFGELAYVLAFVALFQAFSALGLDGLTVRSIAYDRAKAGSILGTVFRLRLIGGAVGWLTACLLMAILRPGDMTALILVAIVAAGLLLQAADVIDLWFQSQTQSRRAVVAKISAYLLANATKVGLILMQAPMWTFAAVQTLDSGLAALCLVMAYRRYRVDTSWRWDTETARNLLKQSWPLMASGLAVMIYMRIDQIMLREMVGDRELGIYSAALPFSQAWNFIPVAICTSLLPALSRNYVEDRGLFYARLQKLFTLVTWCAIGLVATVAISSHWLVGLLLGGQYEQSALVISIHVFTNIFIFLGVAQGQWILNENRGFVALAKTTIGAVTNIVANLFLIPLYGALGAAMAAVLAQAASAVLSNSILAPRIFGMQMRAIFPVRSITHSE